MAKESLAKKVDMKLKMFDQYLELLKKKKKQQEIKKKKTGN